MKNQVIISIFTMAMFLSIYTCGSGKIETTDLSNLYELTSESAFVPYEKAIPVEYSGSADSASLSSAYANSLQLFDVIPGFLRLAENDCGGEVETVGERTKYLIFTDYCTNGVIFNGIVKVRQEDSSLQFAFRRLDYTIDSINYSETAEFNATVQGNQIDYIGYAITVNNNTGQSRKIENFRMVTTEKDEAINGHHSVKYSLYSLSGNYFDQNNGYLLLETVYPIFSFNETRNDLFSVAGKFVSGELRLKDESDRAINLEVVCENSFIVKQDLDKDNTFEQTSVTKYENPADHCPAMTDVKGQYQALVDPKGRPRITPGETIRGSIQADNDVDGFLFDPQYRSGTFRIFHNGGQGDTNYGYPIIRPGIVEVFFQNFTVQDMALYIRRDTLKEAYDFRLEVYEDYLGRFESPGSLNKKEHYYNFDMLDSYRDKFADAGYNLSLFPGDLDQIFIGKPEAGTLRVYTTGGADSFGRLYAISAASGTGELIEVIADDNSGLNKNFLYEYHINPRSLPPLTMAFLVSIEDHTNHQTANYQLEMSFESATEDTSIDERTLIASGLNSANEPMVLTREVNFNLHTRNNNWSSTKDLGLSTLGYFSYEDSIIDKNGVAHIVNRTSIAGFNERLGYRNSSSDEEIFIDFEGNFAPKLAQDSQGNVFLFLSTYNSVLGHGYEVRRFVDGAWAYVEPLTQDFGNVKKFALSTVGKYHIVSVKDNGLWYFTNRSGSWQNERLSSDSRFKSQVYNDCLYLLIEFQKEFITSCSGSPLQRIPVSSEISRGNLLVNAEGIHFIFHAGEGLRYTSPEIGWQEQVLTSHQSSKINLINIEERNKIGLVQYIRAKYSHETDKIYYLEF